MTRPSPVPDAYDTAGVDRASVDGVLATTRSVRRRLDLERPVPDDVLLDCIDLAEQSPTGGNQGSRRWMIVRDPERKRAVADVYQDVGRFMIEARDRQVAEGRTPAPLVASAAHLAEHLAEVPVLVIPCIWGVHAGDGRPGLFDSVIQGAWSFCLAARARGLATAWTTSHLTRPEVVADALGIPDGVTQIALLPVAWSDGTSYRAAPRRPAEEITYVDDWGRTYEAFDASAAHRHMGEGPGVVVEIDIQAPPRRVFELVSDINVGAPFSDEFVAAEWLDGATEPAVGARFAARNSSPRIGEWTVDCTVTEFEPGLRIGWATGPTEDEAGARWRYEVDHLQSGDSRLRHTVRLGPGSSGLTAFIAENPESEPRLIAGRQRQLRDNMQAVIEGIRDRAEAPG